MSICCLRLVFECGLWVNHWIIHFTNLSKKKPHSDWIWLWMFRNYVLWQNKSRQRKYCVLKLRCVTLPKFRQKRSIVYCRKCSDIWSTARTEVDFFFFNCGKFASQNWTWVKSVWNSQQFGFLLKCLEIHWTMVNTVCLHIFSKIQSFQ